ncbi:F-box/WD repeat-containing protein 12-like, partial [Myotis lucifugus]|uniref:F-box/WD repeat-containing protein 12-like n=1 Tax=Myotis lucifugus TaxID=59463 RepID=UPI000CCC128B
GHSECPVAEDCLRCLPGVLGPLAYFSGSGPSMSGQRSIVCTVSSRRTLCAWDVRAGSLIWSSPAQQANIRCLATLPPRSLAFTVDKEETVKVWNCQDAEPLAARSMPRCCCSLEAFLADDGPVLLVGDSEGDIYTLTVPALAVVSLVKALDYGVELLHCSPNRKWVFASGTHPYMRPKVGPPGARPPPRRVRLASPQVFSAEGLLRPGGSAPSSVSLPFTFCSQACWALKCANRVAVMFQRGSGRRTGFGTFDLAAKSPGGSAVLEGGPRRLCRAGLSYLPGCVFPPKTARQIAAFMLPDEMEGPLRMGVRDGDTIIFESGPYLFLFSIHGHLVHRFSHHQNAICSLWVDSLHVLTTSLDNYLHLYMWEEGGRDAGLQSCCHLEQRPGDPTPSCYYSRAICDSASIVCVVSRTLEASVLVMYSLDP